MKTNMMILALIATLGGATAFAAETENLGTLNITVVDENGALVPDAPVYIYGEHKTKFVGGKDIPGTTTFTMPAGTYRISSAIVKKNNDYIDRFASNEAHIEVIPGDNTVITLTLKPLEDAVASLGYVEARRMGISSAIAQNLN